MPHAFFNFGASERERAAPLHASPDLPPALIPLPRRPQDIQDRRGDGEAGVQTLPVVLGPRAALAVGLALLGACLALAAHAALLGSGLAWAWAARPALEPYARAAALAAVAWTLSKPCAAAIRVLRSGFGKEETSEAISVAMSSVGLGTLLLAVLA